HKFALEHVVRRAETLGVLDDCHLYVPAPDGGVVHEVRDVMRGSLSVLLRDDFVADLRAQVPNLPGTLQQQKLRVPRGLLLRGESAGRLVSVLVTLARITDNHRHSDTRIGREARAVFLGGTRPGSLSRRARSTRRSARPKFVAFYRTS